MMTLEIKIAGGRVVRWGRCAGIKMKMKINIVVRTVCEEIQTRHS